MKANKIFSIDDVLIKRLKKESNASEIVNTLLLKYYKTKGALSIEEMDSEIKDTEILISEQKGKLNKLNTLKTAEIKAKNREKESFSAKMRQKFGKNNRLVEELIQIHEKKTAKTR
jgi:hypothetical protein